jgi:hypothetical protein
MPQATEVPILLPFRWAFGFDSTFVSRTRSRTAIPLNHYGRGMGVVRQSACSEESAERYVYIMSDHNVLENQKLILDNQKTILANQGVIQHNQEVIKNNQQALDTIRKNQDTILQNQGKILAVVGK